MTLVLGAALFAVGVFGLLARRDASGLFVSCVVCVAGALVTAAGAARPALPLVATAAAVAYLAIFWRLTHTSDDGDESGDDAGTLKW